MSGEINTIHIPEQDALFKSILCIGVEFLEEKTNFGAVDKKSMDIIARRRRGCDKHNVDDKKEKAKEVDITKHILLVLPEGRSKLKYKDISIDVILSHRLSPKKILENIKFKIEIKNKSTESEEYIKEFIRLCNKEI